jgi:TonB family protein
MKSKIKIMNPKPQVSDEEIRSFMDFEGLLQQRNVIVHRNQLMVKAGAAILILAVVITTVMLFNSPDKPSSISANPDSATTNLPPFTSNTSPQDDNGESEINRNAELQQGTEHQTPKAQKPAAGEPESQKAKRAETAQAESNKAVAGTSPAAESIYVQAEPVEGYENLFAFFRENLTYPQAAMKDSIQGVMKISFVIDEKGKPVNIRIDETLGTLFDEEAVKLIESMPPWKPALLNDKPVKSRISLPLTFEIKKARK